jgi:putative oxidoreductase
METLRNFALLVARVAMAGVFIYDATLLAQFPDNNVAFMEKFGVPGAMLWPTAAFQLIAGLLLVLGLATRLSALAFAGFCALTALVFHHDFAQVSESIQFGKDAALAGGFLALAVAGAGAWSVDRRLDTDFWPFRSVGR